MAKQIVLAHFVTEAQAEAVLAEVRPRLRHWPQIAQFREHLDATVGTVWAIHRAVKNYRAADEALRQLRQSTKQTKIALQAMEGSAASPEMVNYTDLPKLDVVRPFLVAVDKLEHELARVPATFSGQHKPPKGRAPRAWYPGFVRDLAEIAKELGIEVRTAGDRKGDRKDDPYTTPFTRFVFAVEKLLPPSCELTSRRRRSGAPPTRAKEQSASLPACVRRIDRAIEACSHEIAIERAFKAYAHEIGDEQAIEVLRSRDF